MDKATNYWQGLPQRARTGLIVGVLVIAAVTGAAGWWLMRADYQVLFSDLKPQDAQAMVTELDRLKVPYRLTDGGTSILVDKDVVHPTRLKLMGKDMPLHGAVGLELFNNTDFGMTEFAQKINYQRALQGEITRTILSLAEVRDVRVLLALPEQGLFKQAASKAKASITVSMKQGRALSKEQISGIQRLVAAAVPSMTTQDVTIVDSQGVALTRADAGETDGANPATMDLKRDMETYLGRKVAAVLEQTFGVGQALASVDVTLNMDQIRSTTEDVLPANARAGMQATGVVVREREVLRDPSGSADARATDTFSARGAGSQREVEYSVGRRVEQVVRQAGSVRRIQVVAVVQKPLSAVQEDRLRQVIAAAAGAVIERGDTVVIQSVVAAAPNDAVTSGLLVTPTVAADAPMAASGVSDQYSIGLDNAVLLAAGLLALVIFLGGRRNRVQPHASAHQPRALSDAERATALRRLNEWLHGGAAEPMAGRSSIDEGRVDR